MPALQAGSSNLINYSAAVDGVDGFPQQIDARVKAALWHGGVNKLIASPDTPISHHLHGLTNSQTNAITLNSWVGFCVEAGTGASLTSIPRSFCRQTATYSIQCLSWRGAELLWDFYQTACWVSAFKEPREGRIRETYSKSKSTSYFCVSQAG